MLAVIIIWPHKSKTLIAHATTQSGIVVDVKLQLRSAWGWERPDRVTDLAVWFNKKPASLEQKVFRGLDPIDPEKRPIVAEKYGFPVVILIGPHGASKYQSQFYFLNYAFSGRRLVVDNQSQDEFATEKQTLNFAQQPVQVAENKPVVLGPDSVHILTAEQIRTYNALHK